MKLNRQNTKSLLLRSSKLVLIDCLRGVEPRGLVIVARPAELARDVGSMQLEIVVQHHNVGVVVGVEPALAAVDPCNSCEDPKTNTKSQQDKGVLPRVQGSSPCQNPVEAHRQ